MPQTLTKKGGITLNPLGDRVCVRRDDPDATTPGGIVLPDGVQSQQQLATVVAVGPGRRLPDGTRAALELKAGDRIVIGMYGPEIIEIHEEQFLLVREDDVLATIEGEEMPALGRT